MNKDKKLIPELRFSEFVNEGEWEVKTLAEVAERIEEKVNDKKLITASISAGIGFVSQAEKFSRDISGTQYTNYIVLNEGDFSYNKGNSKKFPQGCIYKLKEFKQVAVPNAFISFRFKQNFIGDFYQGYFDNNFHGMQLLQFITSGARMDGLLNIKANDFFSIVLPTPSKPEQQKIASCLSSLDEVIAAHIQKLELLKDHKKGLMQNLFPQEGEKVPKFRFSEFKNNGEWVEKELDELGELINGLTYSPEDVREKGLLVLRSSNIQNGLIDLNDCVFVRTDIKGANLSRQNDILVCVRNGSKALIGKNAIIPKGLPLATHGAFMTVFRANNPEFVFQLFQTDFYDKQVKADLGATINSINGKNFIKYIFPVPVNPKEQEKIASCLSSLDALIAAQADKIEQLKLHKKGLMQSLFPKINE